MSVSKTKRMRAEEGIRTGINGVLVMALAAIAFMIIGVMGSQLAVALPGVGFFAGFVAGYLMSEV